MDGMFYAAAELSPRQALLPSGTLWLRDVTIGRTGDQFYHHHELLGVDTDGMADRSGMVRVRRDSDAVFDAQSMASFEGTPIVMGHPEQPVDTDTWRQHAVGHAQNVRRVGDRLVADLLVHDARAISAIRDQGWRGVSCGYDARYVPDGRGLRQTNICGNHIALLPPDQDPRCGPICRVGDARKDRQMRRNVRDQSGAAEHREWLSSERTQGGAAPGGTVGPTLVMTLPGHSSNYFILDLGPGKVGIVCSSEIDGRIDMGNITQGDRPLPTTQRMAAPTARRSRPPMRNAVRWWRAMPHGRGRSCKA
jgi:hypothetical protein